ncbi:MFS transporter [Sphingomonas sp. RP10(2022)]|uniref:MFS transporter n=1 Tax=Sphingomonas liriopis TaxID=2949094 RepID=A0A9X2HLB8_9SPHN|nr:MFS transporter [Sphingomonas liriopis]MCP3733321.1 MFS transporter [Sphingomonas liriopis]
MADAARPAKAPLVALAVAAFGIGTTEFVIMGMLPEVAADLHVGLPAAGLLVSSYALGVAFGGPVLAALLARVPARATLVGLMALFIAGNLGCAIAPTYTLLMLARIVTALCHAAFFGTGAVVAARLAAPGRSAQAIALMISGLTIANVIGVPLGTFIGQAAGWRATFLAVAGIGVVAFLGMVRLLPPVAVARDLVAEVRVLKAPQVWLTLAISTLASTSMFGFFTYITPILTKLGEVAKGDVGYVLLAVGIGLTAGNYLGARLADWRAGPSLVAILAGVATILLIFAAFGRTPWSATVIVTLWGILAFAVCAITQAMVVEAASAAPNLASTLNISAFNLGNAIGAGASAAALSAGWGLAAIPLVAASVAALAATVAIIAVVVVKRPRKTSRTEAAG